jgi:MFS family permease
MSVGSFIGVWVAPYLSDNLGRKKAIIIGSVINLVGVALQSAAVHGVYDFIFTKVSESIYLIIEFLYHSWYVHCCSIHSWFRYCHYW